MDLMIKLMVFITFGDFLIQSLKEIWTEMIFLNHSGVSAL